MLWEIEFEKEHERSLTWEEKFELFGADGIDFVPIGSDPRFIRNVFCSYTKEQFLNESCYPRSQYYFWKNINGYKSYIVDTNNKIDF